MWLKILLALFVLTILTIVFLNAGVCLYNNRYYSEVNYILRENKIKPIESFPELLDVPLYKFHVNTSHNSYLPALQHVSISSYGAIKNAMEMGARCIELDIQYIDDTLVVTHGDASSLFTTTLLRLDKCLDLINKCNTSSDPLILCLEIHISSAEGKKKLRQLLIDKFKDKMLGPEYKLSTFENYKDITTTPMKHLLNKVIIIASVGKVGLEDILDDSNILIKNKEEGDPSLPEENRMLRVYPVPSTHQVLSANFDPEPYWKENANLVAMNFQSKDYNLLKNVKKFKDCSFVLINS